MIFFLAMAHDIYYSRHMSLDNKSNLRISFTIHAACLTVTCYINVRKKKKTR